MDYIGRPPWEHQKQGVELSFKHDNLGLLWDMGTGKSRCVVDILRGRFAVNGRVMRTLIFAPPIVLRNWKREFAGFSRLQDYQVKVLTGTGKKRTSNLKSFLFNEEENQYSRNIVLILNYECLRNEELFSILQKWAPEIVVCDEAHRCKNPQALQSKLVAKLSDLAKHRYILTGTPILNSMMDIFQQYRILDGGSLFGKNFYVFRTQFFEDENAAWSNKQGHFPKFIPRASAFDEFSRRIYSIGNRVTKEECMSLPPLITTSRDVELSPEQERMYKEMKNEFITFVKSKETEGTSPAVVAQLAVTKALRLQQIISGFAKDDAGNVHSLESVPRLAVLKELLQEITEAGHKVLVWSVFKENYAQIRRICDDIGVGYAEVHGETKDKQASIDRLENDPDCKVIIAHPRSGGIGANMTAASYSIRYSRDFSLENYLQSRDRNHRGGSERHEKITHIDLVARGTIDELILEALENKQNIASMILEWRNKL